MPTVENPFNWAKKLIAKLHEDGIKIFLWIFMLKLQVKKNYANDVLKIKCKCYLWDSYSCWNR